MRVLAAEAQDCGSGNVRMVDVPREQPAEVSGVLVRSAATRLVQEKFYAIEILKYFGGRARPFHFAESEFL